MSTIPTNTTPAAFNPPSNTSVIPSDPWIGLRVGIGTAACLVFIVGFFGNLTILVTIIRNRRKGMNSLMYYLIGNLAVYDIFVMLISLPMTIVQDLSFYWVFGSFLCHVTLCLPFLFAAGSITTMVAISIDRYLVVLRAANPEPKQAKKGLATVFIFCLAFCFALPSVIYTVYLAIPDSPQCLVQFSTDVLQNNESLRIYTCAIFIILFIIPLIVVVCLYSLILHKMRQRTGESNSRFNRAYAKANRRTIKMMLLVSVTFILCWVPLFICFFLIAFDAITDQGRLTFFFIYAVCHLISYCNSALNPLIYAGFTSRFRRSLIYVFSGQIIKEIPVHRCGLQSRETKVMRLSVSKRSRSEHRQP